MSKYLATMPYKLGDVLWTFPAAKALAEKWGDTIDFATSHYCDPLLPLIAAQSWVDRTIVSPAFDDIIKGDPHMMWQQELNFNGWEKQHHFRFVEFPNKWIPQYFADQAEVKISEPLTIDVPMFDGTPPYPRYLVANIAKGYGVGLKGELGSVIHHLIDRAPLPVVIVGKVGEFDGSTRKDVLDLSGLDMAATAQVIQKAQGYIGFSSSNATLAGLVGTRQYVLMPKWFVQHWAIFRGGGDSIPYAIDDKDDLLRLLSDLREQV